MRGVWKNEQGSALLLVMMGVMIAGIVLGGLYLAIGSATRQAATHREQVVAEYDAQGMMNIALAYYYNNKTQFDQMLPSNNSCIDASANLVSPSQTPNVCLQINGTTETLVATGTDHDPKLPSPFYSQTLGTQSNKIIYTLTGGSQPPTPPAPLAHSDNNPSPGQTCPSVKQDSIMRALVAGSDFNTKNADSVYIDGGVYLGNDAELIVPKTPDSSQTITINGNVTAEGGYQLDHGDGKGDVVHHPLSNYGNNNNDMSCNVGATSWNSYLNSLANEIQNTIQQVPVYFFTGNVDVLTSTGKQKAVGDAYFSPTIETLGSILTSPTDKIVLIQGNLTLPSSINSTGYLVVYNTATHPGTILLPTGVNWTHSGAIAAEQIAWPTSYRFSVSLTNNQYNLYKQTN